MVAIVAVIVMAEFGGGLWLRPVSGLILGASTKGIYREKSCWAVHLLELPIFEGRLASFKVVGTLAQLRQSDGAPLHKSKLEAGSPGPLQHAWGNTWEE